MIFVGKEEIRLDCLLLIGGKISLIERWNFVKLCQFSEGAEEVIG